MNHNRHIFTLIIRVILFRLIHEIFLTVDDHNMDECLESSWHLVYYQVSGEPAIAGCSRQSCIYLREVWTCVYVYALIMQVFSHVKYLRLV